MHIGHEGMRLAFGLKNKPGSLDSQGIAASTLSRARI